MSANVHGSWRVTRETCEKSATWTDRTSISSRPSRESRSAILLEQSALLEIIFVNDGGGVGGKLSPFLQHPFDVFPD